ncbi:MAG: T9SS type A sorting domain-containing protein, partial [Candidatus Marinimicrobia bacterium]|nr:T9SS type A sorting domain-containing protein [Candidatus Neomarinimicrobiota bacterium]
NEIHESDYYAYKRDLYICTSDDGATWSNPINITNTPDLDENEVSAFDDVIDNKLHITYTEDQLPGNDMMLVSTFKYDDQYAGPYQTNDVYIKHMAVDLGGVGIDDGKLARNFKLEQNYPNPFNPTTKISYSIPSISNVKLMVYNILGQKVKTLVDNQLIAGNHTAMWDGTNDAGSQVSSGIYIYKLKTKAGVRVKKMVLQK